MANLQTKAVNNLPKLRKGLTIGFNDYDMEGKPQWLIYDPSRNKFFLVGWPEYEIYLRWELGTPEKIIASINAETTLHVEATDIENFTQFLLRNYLTKMSGYDIHKQANEQELFKNDNIFHWLISNYLFFRIPLVQPDYFLSRTKSIADVLFSRYMLYIMSFLGLVALYQISARWELFTHTFASIFTLKGLIFSLIAFVICKTCHELGHAYMCKHYGIPVPTFGIAFLVFWPVLYTDTTLSWSLTYKKRLKIALAGIWVETYITIIAALIWANVDNLTIQSVCYVTITVNWLASLLINVSPFMRFDGYYVLADYLKMPNLQFRAFALTRWQIRSWLFGWQDPPPEKFSRPMHNFLIIYSLFTWIYRLSLYIGIAALVYHFFAKIVGVVLFIIEVHYFILAPFINEINVWISQREKFSLNLRTKITCVISIILVTLFFLPFHQTITLPATISYTHQFIIAPEAGILIHDLPPNGSPVKANTPIIFIKSPQLEQALRETTLEYSKTVGQLRRAGVNPEFIEQKNALLSDIARLKSEYQKLLNIKSKLALSVPFDGILVDTISHINAGTYIMKDQWIADVINPKSILIEAFAAQIDINLLSVGIDGYFYNANLHSRKVPVTISSIEVLNSKQLDCRYADQLKQTKGQDTVIETPCYNASELGGEVPTYQSDDGNYVPTNSVYRVILQTNAEIDLMQIERGTVFLQTKPRSFAYRFFYRIKSLLIEEINF